MMRRSAFKRPARPARPTLVLVRQAMPMNVRMASGLASAKPVVLAKQDLVRDDDYRRLVASLPCCHCTIQRRSQAAHENEGKGKALKVCDTRTFPLCTVNGNGCHEAFDAYRLVPGGRDAHVELGRTYTACTQQALRLLARHDPSARRIVERVIGL